MNIGVFDVRKLNLSDPEILAKEILELSSEFSGAEAALVGLLQPPSASTLCVKDINVISQKVRILAAVALILDRIPTAWGDPAYHRVENVIKACNILEVLYEEASRLQQEPVRFRALVARL
jgi:hypothetical protein